MTARTDPPHSPCQSCGACCDYAPSWPRFSIETEEEIGRIPSSLIARDGSGMRCNGNRCAALTGDIGQATACSIYEVRPDVCRACQPGDDACNIARTWHGLSPIGDNGIGGRWSSGPGSGS